MGDNTPQYQPERREIPQRNVRAPAQDPNSSGSIYGNSVNKRSLQPQDHETHYQQPPARGTYNFDTDDPFNPGGIASKPKVANSPIQNTNYDFQ